MTRTGKIARLPRHIREEINLRLDNGDQGKALLRWLNSLDEVKQILAADFAGRPINAQNLSDWKQGGFLDWQSWRDNSDRIRLLAEHHQDLDNNTAERNIPDLLAGVLAAELAAQAQRLLEQTTDPGERWLRLRQALRQLHQLRRGDYRAAHARMEMARWQVECEKRAEESQRQAMREAYEHVMEPIAQAAQRPTLVAAYGGGEKGAKAADFILEMQRKYRVRKFPLPEFQPPPDQAQSR